MDHNHDNAHGADPGHAHFSNCAIDDGRGHSHGPRECFESFRRHRHCVIYNGGCQLHGGAHECHKMDERLYVVTAVFNPRRYQTVYDNYRRFEEHMAMSGAILYTVEMAYNDRPFYVTSPCDPRDLQVRGNSEIWLKENLLNLCVQRLPHDWKYVAWIDCDIQFLRPDWVEQTVEALQHYDVIQPWSECYDLGPDHQHVALHRSFMRQYSLGASPPRERGGYGDFWHPGYAWAMTRNAWNKLGGLFDKGILGAGDHHMALCLIGQGQKSLPRGISASYRREVMAWQNRAEALIRRNVGYIEGAIRHHWHGRKVDRRYRERWEILIQNKYDPDHDIVRNSYGVYELAQNTNTKLRDDIRSYFLMRRDDANTLS